MGQNPFPIARLPQATAIPVTATNPSAVIETLSEIAISGGNSDSAVSGLTDRKKATAPNNTNEPIAKAKADPKFTIKSPATGLAAPATPPTNTTKLLAWGQLG